MWKHNLKHFTVKTVASTCEVQDLNFYTLKMETMWVA